MKDKNAIVNLASADNYGYVNGQERLSGSLVGKYNGNLLLFGKEGEVVAPPHKENPYAFKIYCIDKAIEMGYRKILWLDASVYAVANVTPVFDIIEKEGYIMQDIVWKVGTWANDRSLEYFKITRDEAMEMTCYGNAGFLGLNFEFEIAQEFFKRWKQSMLDGIFKGAWNNDTKSESQDERCRGHRHDLTCGSIIANQLGMKLQPADQFLQYASPTDPILNETIIFKAQGM